MKNYKELLYCIPPLAIIILVAMMIKSCVNDMARIEEKRLTDTKSRVGDGHSYRIYSGASSKNVKFIKMSLDGKMVLTLDTRTKEEEWLKADYVEVTSKLE